MEIDKFNETIDIWIDGLSHFHIKKLLIKPDERSWSLGQVYEHIIEESNWFNEQIEKALANNENAEKESSDEAKTLFQRGTFKNVRVKGDPFISEKVKQPISLFQLKSDLEKLKRDTNEIWERILSVSKSGKSEHPGLGFFSGKEWIQYSEMHLRHHLKQKKRIEKLFK